MSEFTYDEQIFSDLYKDVYGFRPRSHRFWDATPAEKQVIWDDLLEDLDRENAYQAQKEAESVEAFEARIADTIAMGAADRETAIRWLIEAGGYDECDLRYGGSFLCYEWGLPYSYMPEFEGVITKLAA